jgi:Tfp pilus assembly protein PilO
MNKINLNKMRLWSISLKSVMIVALIFLIFSLGYFFYLKSILQNKKTIFLQLILLEKKLKEQQLIVSEYFNYRKKVNILKDKFNYLNPKNNIILFMINGQLLSDSFRVNDIKISSIKKKVILIEVRIKNDLTGANDNIIELLYQIANLKCCILLENFRWNFFNSMFKDSSSNKEIFLYFKIVSLDLDRENFLFEMSQFNRVHIKNLSVNNLEKYSLNNLKMIGALSVDKKKNWGLIKLPTNQICKVQLGDEIGLEHGLVIAIHPKEIFIQNNAFDKLNKLSMENRKSPYAKFLFQ